MRVITRLSLAAALTASLALGACASRKPLPTTLPQAGDPAAGGVAGAGSQPPPGPPVTGGPMPSAGNPMGPASGMPGAPAPGSMQAFVIEAGDRVFFDTDSHGLHDQAVNTLTAQAAWLSRNPAVRVIVEGNADERGTREYNLALGARRANAVRDFLVSQGVIASRIETVSYGKERPISEGADESAWSQNRNARTNFQGQGGL